MHTSNYLGDSGISTKTINAQLAVGQCLMGTRGNSIGTIDVWLVV